MWKQISLSDALRAFLSGQTVKVVDFTEDTVLSLQDVFQRFGGRRCNVCGGCAAEA